LNYPTRGISTDEIDFLIAFLLHNQDASTCFHIRGPAIMDKVHTAYKVMEKAVKENRKNAEAEMKQLNEMIWDIRLYIDTRLDILENKFLVFICNIGSNHWVSVVVVNPNLIFDKFSPEDNCEQSVIPKAYDLCG
jgi:hypothetical protein